MRLQDATITGYGRLMNCKVHLSEKVIAVVGPNEAGKTTLLRAIEFADSKEPLPIEKRSRKNRPGDDDPVIVTTFQVETADREAIREFDIEEQPVTLRLTRTAGGKLRYSISPDVLKKRDDLNSSAATFVEVADEIGNGLPEDDPNRDVVRDLIATVYDVLKSEWVTISDVNKQEIQELISALTERVDATEAVEALQTILAWAEIPSPEKEIFNRLWQRTPDFLMFDDEDRTLLSTYDLTDELVDEPPKALKNLLSLADLDLAKLFESMDDTSFCETEIRRANLRLKARFEESWHQSDVAASLKIEGSQLRVYIEENQDTITTFDERSAGLRSYVALFAFVATHKRNVPPVLLVDEAETHLHYDAQSNLVDTFFAQEVAAKVIYTTHSPGCLPPDLGRGIRIVVPSEDSSERSEVRNSFWGGPVPGFSPLLIAMGASAAAFSVTRYAVIAEGACEMILLPSLLRKALGLEHLPYQIAPGLSETGMALYPELDGQAARTAFVVDNDPGGGTLRGQLEKAGIAKSKICTLGASTLEDVVDLESYVHAVNEELHTANRSKRKSIDIDDIPDMYRAKFLEEWCRRNSLKCPSKIAVAVRLVEEDKATPSTAGAKMLVDLDRRVRSALGL